MQHICPILCLTFKKKKWTKTIEQILLINEVMNYALCFRGCIHHGSI